jgi:hypothetical protein
MGSTLTLRVARAGVAIGETAHPPHARRLSPLDPSAKAPDTQIGGAPRLLSDPVTEAPNALRVSGVEPLLIARAEAPNASRVPNLVSDARTGGVSDKYG